jgi:hypothetical protein
MAMLIAGCTPTGPRGDNGKNGGDDDTWKTIAGDEGEMYKTLVQGAMGSLRDISDQKVNTTNPIFSIDSKLKLEFNEFNLWLEFKMNYKLNDDKVLKFSAEILNDDESEVIVGAYFMDGYLYLKLLDGEAGKMKFPIKNQVIGDLFPIKYKTTDVAAMSVLLSSIIEVQGNITGKTRTNGTIHEFQYSFDINLPKTLQKIVDSFDLEQMEGIDTDMLSIIIQRVLGVTLEDIEAGNLPSSSVSVDFATSGQKLTNFKLNLDVDQSTSQNTLFGGGDIDVTIDLEKLTIDNKYTSIPFFTKKIETPDGDLVDEYTTYQNYLDQSFGVRFAITEKGDTAAENRNFFLKAEMKLDIEEVNGNDVLIEILDEDGKPITGLYFDDGMLYLYTTKEDDGYQKRQTLELDVVELFERIFEGDIIIDNPEPSEKREAIEYVAFVIGALRITDEKISFTIDDNFYDVLLPGFENIIQYANDILDNPDIDLEEILFEAFDTDIIEYLMARAFEFTIDLAEEADSFVYIIDGDIGFPEDMIEEQ